MSLRSVDPTIVQEMRYTTAHTFMGERVDGYLQPVCVLTRPAPAPCTWRRGRCCARGTR